MDMSTTRVPGINASTQNKSTVNNTENATKHTPSTRKFFFSETELNNFPRLQPSGEVKTRPRRFSLRRRG